MYTDDRPDVVRLICDIVNLCQLLSLSPPSLVLSLSLCRVSFLLH